MPHNNTTGTLGNNLNGVTSGVNNLTKSVGLGGVLSPGTTTTTTPGLVGGLGNAAGNLLDGG